MTGGKPLGGTSITGSLIELPRKDASIEPVVSLTPVSGFTIAKSGIVVWNQQNS